MKKELAIAIATFTAACNGSVIEQPTPAFVPLPTDTPYPTVEVIPTRSFSREEIEKSVFDQVGTSLAIIANHPDTTISGINERLYLGQQSGNLEVSTSQPRFNEEGNLINGSQEPPIGCHFSPEGNFLIILNTNFYFFNPSYPYQATATHLDICLNYQKEIDKKYQFFLESNPEISLTDALVINPDWLSEAFVEASYKTTSEIIVPYKDSLPLSDWGWNLFVDIYEKCEGDASCWKEEILNLSPKDSFRL